MNRRLYQLSEELYQQFNGFPPGAIEIHRFPRIVPPVVVELGELRGLIYRSDKWNPGRPRSFIHFMDDPPKLACNPQGTQLYIIGGSYRVTPQGIEG
jgi:hypothetical protein